MSELLTDSVSSLYPPPPPYVKFFTNENVARYNQLKREGKTAAEISQLTDLRFLVPPVQPDRPTYRSFGDVWNFEDRMVSLQESGVQKIYDDEDEIKDDSIDEEESFTIVRINQLKKMTKSLLLNFLELVGILSKNPHYSHGKIEEIRILLINLHHLLNSYRLHQSRESLILRIQQKVSDTKDEVEKIRQTCKIVEDKIKLLSNGTSLELNSTEFSTTKTSNKEPNPTELLELAKREAIESIVKSIKNSS